MRETHFYLFSSTFFTLSRSAYKNGAVCASAVCVHIYLFSRRHRPAPAARDITMWNSICAPYLTDYNAASLGCNNIPLILLFMESVKFYYANCIFCPACRMRFPRRRNANLLSLMWMAMEKARRRDCSRRYVSRRHHGERKGCWSESKSRDWVRAHEYFTGAIGSKREKE